MNVLIIEDEQNAADELSALIAELYPSAVVLEQLDSVHTACGWLNSHQSPDLIFMDIHLGDGNAFEIFETCTIESPVIFCTAFDDYLMEAFSTNGIGYILKPTTSAQVKTTVTKFLSLKKHFTLPQIEALNTVYKKNYKTSYLVHFKEKMIPIAVESILCFCVKDNLSYAVTADGEYMISKTLDQLEAENNPAQFYRVNRQCLVSFRHIKSVAQAPGRKLEINVENYSSAILVSKEKALLFRHWMDHR